MRVSKARRFTPGGLFFEHRGGASLHDLVGERYAFRIVLLEPFVGKFCRRENLKVIDVANLCSCRRKSKRSSLIPLQLAFAYQHQPHLLDDAEGFRKVTGLRAADNAVVSQRTAT